jgi:hypothetical protein
VIVMAVAKQPVKIVVKDLVLGIAIRVVRLPAKAHAAVDVKPRVIQPTVNKSDARGLNLPNYFESKGSAYWHVSLSRYE